MSSKFGQIQPQTTELAAFERRKKFPQTYNGENYVIIFSRLFLIGSFSYLQVMRTCIKAWMSLKLGQIPPLTMELAALERLKNRRHHFFSVAIDPILFKLADNEDMHNIFDELEFWPDLTTDYRVSCPWASEKIPTDITGKTWMPLNDKNFTLSNLNISEASWPILIKCYV